MSSVRPRLVAHRGTVEAAGFAFDVALVGVAEARRRVLAAWALGATVYRAGELLVLRLANPVRVDAKSAPGAPLVEAHGALVAAPLSPDEAKRLAPGWSAAVVVRGGVALAVPLAESDRERPEAWLDVSDFRLVDVVSLGPEPEAPHVVAAPEPFEARAKLGSVGPPPPEIERVIAALEGRIEPGAAGDGGARALASEVRVRIARTVSFVAAALARVRAALRRLQPERAAGSAPSRPAEPGLLDRLMSRMERLGAWLLLTARLDGIVGRRQAEYISRMMAMLEEGDIADGLRHAIPLGAFEGLKNPRPSLGVPRPRADIRITPERRAAGSSIGLGGDLMGEIRRLYRATFERLEAQGRIEEAAFVLAELLRADEEAVALLERHGRKRLAAEIAEARNLPPGLVVRQWFVAGDRHRAVAVARRTSAFADAVLRLERTDKQQAEVLRLLWAASLADAGDYAAAVEVAWPVESARRLALAWMDRAIELGGVGGAKMLAKRLEAAPTDATRLLALELLEEEAPEGATARAALATALSTGARVPAVTTVARAAARALLRDARFATAARPTVYRTLVEAASDGALRSDLPPLPQGGGGALRGRGEAVTVSVEAGDAGALPATDAVFLPDGRTLVALGEAGARLVARDGRTIAAFDEPAHRLVVSNHGDRALALAPRGDVWRLARIDLLSRRAEAWCEARVDAWADGYDGSLWFIGAGEDFYAIDATARGFDALWRVPDVGGHTLAISRNAFAVTFLVTEGWGVEEWRYDLPLLRLRARNAVPLVPDNHVAGSPSRLAIAPEGVVADQTALFEFEGDSRQISPVAQLALRLVWAGAIQRSVPLGEPGDVPLSPSIFAGLVAAPILTPSGARVRLVETASGRVLVDVELAGAGAASTRVREDSLTIADDRGRLLVFDLASGALVRNLRL